ncbi:hypothetical protein B7494_g6220 [Chlorociboria aeruginascens]|nr:hypothetical protein B7494_g6220 [Chlorociboria aeruginascens]
MRGANDMDGVVGLTQCAIPPFKTYTYKFKVQDDQSGTFWYHAHSELQRMDGLYGGIIIHKPGNGESEKKLHTYDEDLILLVGDWYHRSAEEIQKYYVNYANFGNEPAPDSILMNGKGAFNCSQAVPSRPLECKYMQKPHLRMNGKRTRLRIINTGGLTGFTLSMSGHKMTVFQVDGGNSVLEAPPADSVGILYPGERIDVLVERSSDDETQEILEVRLDKEFRNFALTPIQHFPILPPRGRRDVSISSSNGYTPASPFNLAEASGPTNLAKSIPLKADQTFLLYTKIEILAVHGNSPLGVMNRSSWDQSNSNPLPLLAMDRSQWGKSFVPVIGPGTENWVDIILNNLDDKGHPFHLHGYSFYVLSTHKARTGSYDVYNPFDESKEPAGGPMNMINPIMKDTVFIPRMGYVVIRFKADNEGLRHLKKYLLTHYLSSGFFTVTSYGTKR